MDDCAGFGIQCYNDGTCVDGLHSLTCICPPGHTGPYCESNLSVPFINGNGKIIYAI